MKSINWEGIEEHEVVDGIYGKFLHTETMTFVRWRFDAGADLPVHTHPHEQVSMIESGKLELTINEEKIILVPGDVIPVQSQVSHGGKALVPTIAIDVFHPVREDFVEKFG